MSATGRGAERQPDDFYETPKWATQRLLEACPLPSGLWYEPACGAGAIFKAVNALRPELHWLYSDINPRLAGARIENFLTYPAAHADVLITNPPYSLAFEFAKKAVQEATHVVLLLRLNWLASAERAEWLQQHTPNVYVLPNRPSFADRVECKACGMHSTIAKQAVALCCPQCGELPRRAAATDATDYAWMHWHSGATGKLTILNTTPKEERI